MLHRDHYYCLLQRYARRLIHNEEAAAAIAAQALQDLLHTEGPVIDRRLRHFLKTDVHNRCHYWKQARIFDRPPVAVPVSKPFREQQPPAIEP